MQQAQMPTSSESLSEQAGGCAVKALSCVRLARRDACDRQGRYEEEFVTRLFECRFRHCRSFAFDSSAVTKRDSARSTCTVIDHATRKQASI